MCFLRQSCTKYSVQKNKTLSEKVYSMKNFRADF